MYFTCISLITTVILIAVSICYLFHKIWSKTKELLPFHDTNNKLREVLY